MLWFWFYSIFSGCLCTGGSVCSQHLTDQCQCSGTSAEGERAGAAAAGYARFPPSYRAHCTFPFPSGTLNTTSHWHFKMLRMSSGFVSSFPPGGLVYCLLLWGSYQVTWVHISVCFFWCFRSSNWTSSTWSTWQGPRARWPWFTPNTLSHFTFQRPHPVSDAVAIMSVFYLSGIDLCIYWENSQ